VLEQRIPSSSFFSDPHRACVGRVLDRIRTFYGSRLAALVVYGSYAQGRPRLNSDLDLFIVLDRGTRYRLSLRNEEFVRNVEQACEEELQALYRQGISMELSPLILHSDEARNFLPVYLDMVSHRVVIEDRDGFFERILDRVKGQMSRWGSRRVEMGGHWVWEIRPNMKWNEVIRYDE